MTREKVERHQASVTKSPVTMGSTTVQSHIASRAIFCQQNYFNNNSLTFHEDDEKACIINPRI